MTGERQGRHPEPSHVARYQWASSHLQPSDNVLDIFCGNGYGSRILAQRCTHVTSFDKFCGLVSSPKITYLRSVFPKTALDPHAYNAITMFEAIEHVNRKTGIKLLTAARFWLKQGGQLFLSTPNAEVIPFDAKRYPFHFLHYTHHELEDLLFKSGFDEVTWFNQEKKGSVVIRPTPRGTYMIAKVK